MKRILTLAVLAFSMTLTYAQETAEQKAQRLEQERMMEIEQKMQALEAQMAEVEKQAAELEKKAREMERVAQGGIPEPPSIPEPDTTIIMGDTTKVRFGKNEMIIVENDDETIEINWGDDDWSDSEDGTVNLFTQGRNRVFQGFEIGATGFSFADKGIDFNTPAGLEPYEINVGKSWSWSLNFLEADMRIINEYMKFSTGLGYHVKNFSFENNNRMTLDNGMVSPVYDSSYTLAKNRMRAGYLTVPAIIHFNTNKIASRSFRVGAGVIGGLNIFKTYKTKYFNGSQKVKTSAKGAWPYQAFAADARVIVGYGNVNLFTQMSILPLFKDARGPEVYPVMFGINFTNNYD